MCKTGKCSLDRCVGCELADLRAIGDTMQSALSRIITRLEGQDPFKLLGYEGYQALLEGGRSIEEWTEARSKSK